MGSGGLISELGVFFFSFGVVDMNVHPSPPS